LPRETTAPPDPAPLESVTVQEELALTNSVVGLHCSEERTGNASKDIGEESEAPLYVADT